MQALLWDDAVPGTLVVPPDEDSCGLVGVVEGQVAVRFAHSAKLCDLRGCSFWSGRAAPFKPIPENMFVEVHQPSTLVRLPASRVSVLADTDPHFVDVLSFVASSYTNMIIENLFAFTTRNLKKRVAQKIIFCVSPNKVSGVSVTRFDANQYELAEMTSSSRNSINRVLQELEEANVITIGYGHINITDGEKLKKIAEI
jgi:CRP-like cAMP-binding protein